MQVRVKSVGSGKEDDPFRAPLPSYKLLAHDEKAGVMLVEIPDTDHPFDEAGLSDSRLTTAEGKEHVVAASEDAHVAWHRHLDQRYQEHQGEFRPEVA